MQAPSTLRYPSPIVAVTREARQGPWAGRRPLHFLPGEYEGAKPAGRYFARLAECEWASIAAFRRFAMELDALGAPQELVDGARAAAHDAIRHSEVAVELAERFGVEPITPLFAQLAPRGIVLVAIDNAVEGCIRETYGALVVAYQAKAAKDHAVRTGMGIIATDNTRHAALAWRASVWLERRLSEIDIARIRRAQHEELAALGREVDPGLSVFERGLLGLPANERVLAMLERLTGELWNLSDQESDVGPSSLTLALVDDSDAGPDAGADAGADADTDADTERAVPIKSDISQILGSSSGGRREIR